MGADECLGFGRYRARTAQDVYAAEPGYVGYVLRERRLTGQFLRFALYARQRRAQEEAGAGAHTQGHAQGKQ